MTEANPEKLVSQIISSIIGTKSKFSVKKTEDTNLIELEIQVPKEEIGKIIGKGGQTLWAIRKLAGVAGVNLGKKVLITLVE